MLKSSHFNCIVHWKTGMVRGLLCFRCTVGTEGILKDLQEMNLVDDFLVNSLTSHKIYGESAARYILECIFRRKIGKLKVVPQRFLCGFTMRRSTRGIWRRARIMESCGMWLSFLSRPMIPLTVTAWSTRSATAVLRSQTCRMRTVRRRCFCTRRERRAIRPGSFGSCCGTWRIPPRKMQDRKV